MSNIVNVDFSHIKREAPQPPSKWDIIPIHTSDRGTFKMCRRKWAWSSPSRLNLVARADQYGIEKNLWFGTGIHYALERYYNQSLKEDPVVNWLSWFDLQYRGGIITEDELGAYVDRNPVRLQGSYNYKVDGLVDIIPDHDEEEFEVMRDTGRGMMEFYKEYAEANDNFAVISSEHDFSVPVLSPKGEPLYMVDNRLMPDGWEPNFDLGNEFGPLIRNAIKETGPIGEGYVACEKQVHARGRMDLIIQDLESGRFGIKDHKTAARIDEDYFRHLELDEQCTSYLAFGELEARLYNLEYSSLEFITYQALLKAYPKPPTITTKGLPSIDRQKESTTAEMFAALINSNAAYKAMYEKKAEWQNYYTWMLQEGDRRFIHRQSTWRNHQQRTNAMTRLYYEAIDMLDDPVCYPNPTKTYPCLNCRFRTPCIAAEDGSDYVSILENGFVSNWDR